MPDEAMTPGEIGRSLVRMERALQDLSGRVLTVDVWKAEREAMELRLRENEKDIAGVQGQLDSKADKTAVSDLAAEVAATEKKRSDNFKWFIGVLLSVAGLAVALAAVLVGRAA